MPLVNQTSHALHRTALRTWLLARAGLTNVVWANQAGDRPSTLPFGVLQIVSRGKQIGVDHVKEELTATVLEKTYIGLREMTVQITIYAAPADSDDDFEASELLEQALAALAMQQVIDTFRVAFLASMDWEVINTVDEQLGERWERRAVADLRLSYRSVLFDDGTDPAPDDGQWIETVDSITEANGSALWSANVHVFSKDFSNDFS